MADVPNIPEKVEATPSPERVEASEATPLVNRLERPEPLAATGSGVLHAVNERNAENGIMPAFNNSEVPSTVADCAKVNAGENLGLPGDRGLSSASAVSTILKAAGVDIEQTMNIADLHKQMQDAGWQESKYTKGDELKPGDLLFTSMNPQGRNVGIVGPDGNVVYSHSIREGRFVGHSNWTSRFVSVMRAPEN